MTLDEINKEWELDSKVNRENAMELMENVPMLLQKWGGIIYPPEARRLRELKKERLKTRLMLEEALSGLMSEKEIMELGIEINLPRGLAVKRNTADRILVEKYVENNPKMEEIEKKVFDQEMKMDIIKEAINSIRFRPNLLKELMEHHRWSEGFN